ncbi:MAG: nickel pincer cofactor biosynthesis protein LarC [Proteobacteria bacterium]|nr:nickel pincer cofactor biosynthesis protein LarC [Pseudomonadota bacterium]MBU1715715.1 nickel pincer cofactor biosynthesis protein LarC [Pseudomonadota bacterium]
MTENQIVAYIDCFSGVSGDMFLGALLAAGLPEELLRQELSKLHHDNFKLDIKRADATLSAIQVSVIPHEHQPHRNWADIRALLKQSSLPDKVKDIALRIFTTLAEAEAKVHGCEVEEVHFHEVGAIDAIVDITGCAIGLDYFKIKRLICSPLPMPRGWINCVHGLLPLPAPAVCEILKDAPVYGVDLAQELVTPTGAAIVKTMSDKFGHLPPMTIRQTGYGAGSRKLANGQANLLRIIIGQARTFSEAQEVEVIETNLDDWSPEGFPFLCERLFDLGALDVSMSSIQMKKGRPGFRLQVIGKPEDGWELKKYIMSETTAIGLRFRLENRLTLPRKSGTVETRWGNVRVKMIESPTSTVIRPEYEDCRRVAIEQHVPLSEVYLEVGCCSPDDFLEE